MRGNNQIQLNAATMNEAMNHYFKTVVFKDWKGSVQTVKETKNGQYSIFDCTLVEPEKGSPENPKV